MLDAQQVLDKVVETQGSGQMVSDDTVYSWQRRMIREEGIYAEPAGATALAGLSLPLSKEASFIRTTRLCVW